MAVYRKDRKILQNRMDSIESHLTNHVTGAERQIAQLRTDMNAKFSKIDDKFDKIDAKFGNKFDKTDSKIDQLGKDMHMNFNNIILAVSGLSHKKNESEFKNNNK